MKVKYKNEPFTVRESPSKSQIRRRLGPLQIINLQTHHYRKGSEVTYKPTPRSKERTAMIIAIAVVKNKPAYILNNGEWIFQQQIRG